MKSKLYSFSIISCLLVLNSTAQFTQPATTKLPSNASQGWYANAVQHLEDLEYGFQSSNTPSKYKVFNSRQRTGFLVNAHGYTVKNIRYKADENQWNASFSVKSVSGKAMPATATVSVSDRQLRYHTALADVEYVNSKEGLRQNFIVHEKPAGSQSLSVKIQVDGDLEGRLLNAHELALYAPDQPDQTLLYYRDLKVWDARHQLLPAQMQYDGTTREMQIVVEDKDAVYPVTIDPVNQTPEWSTSADGLLSGLLSDGITVNASLYGFTVTGLGDVNGDGYGDVAISAPALVNVFSGDGSMASVGAVFVYHGSDTGLSVTPSNTLQPTTAVAGALFGFSVAAGDVNGDGTNDIAVGAPLDHVNVAVSGGTNAQIGKVYIYHGGSSLSSTNPSPLLSVSLNTTGTTLVNATNVAVQALFGFSISITEDMNGDGKQDLLVGAPTYSSVITLSNLLEIQTGGAFLYLTNSSNNNFNTVRSLEAPTFSILGISVSILGLDKIGGLLFGYSVDGTGDYNGDGNPDIVVGAPAGVNLSSITGILTGQVLGGQACVYYGNGTSTGVGTALGARLQAASGGLLGSAANLMGFKVKGVRNTIGARDGNIVVGAPMGGLIPNVLGLTIEAGNVYVFKKKVSSPSSPVASDQTLSSPRTDNSVLNILNTLSLPVMFGASLDNAYDVNCDGFADLLVGEPLGSGTNLSQLQVNAVGGAAYAFLGDGTGGYQATPYFETTATYGGDILSVNAAALFGYSVAGAPNIDGPLKASRMIVGSPAGALDFDGLLNLGSTLGTVLNFAAGDNGPGKSYAYAFSDCSVAGPLPVTLLNFNGGRLQTGIQLRWSATNENSISHYELQRSTDASSYGTIALVFSNGGSQENDYAYLDQGAASGNNFYRLKIIDKDGSFTYSTILPFRLYLEGSGAVSVTPNPVKSQFTLTFNGLPRGNYQVVFYNATGQVLDSRRVQLEQDQQTILLQRKNSMKSGLYWFKIYGKETGLLHGGKIVFD